MNLLSSLSGWMMPAGWALLHFLWQGTLIALLLAAALGCLRKAGPQARGGAALVALLLMAACPVATAVYYHRMPGKGPRIEGPAPSSMATAQDPGHAIFPVGEGFEETGDTKQARSGKPPVVAGVPGSAAHAEAGSLFTWTKVRQVVSRHLPVAVWCWLGGVCLLGLWRFGGWCLLGRWTRRGVSPVPAGLAAAFLDLAKRCGVRRPVRLLASVRVAVPLTAGWLRPVILFPASLLSGLPSGQIEALLAHELAHIRRMDYAVNLLQTALETLLFYHPAVWWTGRIIRQEREYACDDATVAACGDAGGYAQALAGLASLRGPAMAPAARGGVLLSRLRRLLAPGPVPGPALRIPVSLAAAGAVLGLTLFLMGRQDGFAQQNKPQAAAEAKVIRGRILDRNGVVLAMTDTAGVRIYPWGATASHAVGFAGEKARKGTEAAFEDTLAAGQDVSLTLDIRLQLSAEKAMRDARVGRGSAVVLDPADGSILAMVSVPDFDPGSFIPGAPDEGRKKLILDPTGPLQNRAVTPTSPGSVYKVATAIAVCRAGQGQQSYNCAGVVNYGHPYSCWIYASQKGMHGVLNLSGALKNSCNCWFFQAGNDAGMKRILETAGLLGLEDVAPDISQSEQRPARHTNGELPEEWGRRTPGLTANVAIGQGPVEATPLQIASLIATVANGGDVWATRLCQGTAARLTQKAIVPPEQMKPVREGLRQVVNDQGGTGGAARSEKAVIAGKTGSAMTLRKEGERTVEDVRAWFAGFAPYDQPRFAVSILVENGTSGGKSAAPIAKRILEESLALKPGEPAPAPERRAPVEGHFRKLDAVVYGGTK